MNKTNLKIDHIAFQDIPENILIAFILLRDLQDSPEEFDNRIIIELLNTIDSLSTEDSMNLEEAIDLTNLLDRKQLRELANNGKCSLR